MPTVFHIQLSTLSNDEDFSFHEEVTSTLLDINDGELNFEVTSPLSGKAYLADDHLIIQLQIELQVHMPCCICNDNAFFPIELKNHYITKPLSEVKDNIFDFSDELRQAILLEVPAFLECGDGACPKREEVKKYYKKAKKEESEKKEETYFPFQDLDYHLKNEG